MFYKELDIMMMISCWSVVGDIRDTHLSNVFNVMLFCVMISHVAESSSAFGDIRDTSLSNDALCQLPLQPRNCALGAMNMTFWWL